MLISLSWLRTYVEVPVDTPRLVHDLTMVGLNVERVLTTGFGDPKLVVGAVLEVQAHPNADKLHLCRVNLGADDEREIVCGAPNVAEGQTVLVALPGATLPDGTRIRSAKIRGVRSAGMICSERELGLSEEAAGIMVLEGEHTPGMPAADVLAPPDEILEIEVTPNRPDQLSHLGVAREVAAIYRSELRVPETPWTGDDESPDFVVEIADAADCPRYVGKRVHGVRVGPSPAWLVRALESVGLHSVNNIVDVTNYVMMEMGQPLHAFDFGRLHDARVLVRRARQGERLLSLDGDTRELDPGVLVIADGRSAVAVAGVIGGEATAVHEDTREILIESASFDPVRVRRTRKALAVSTDASYRFERGVDREGCRRAAERAAALICELTGAKPGAVVDAYERPHETRTQTIRQAAVQRILGNRLNVREIEELLGAFGFEAQDRTKDAVKVRVPSWRRDIVEEIDLIEEVARLHGYERLGQGWTFRCTTVSEEDPFEAFVDEISAHMAARGYSEVVTSSFTDGREVEGFPWASGDIRKSPIVLRNPLNVNHRCLRTSLLPGMFEVLRRNLDRGTCRIRAYEVGRVFLSEAGAEKLPDERRILSIVASEPDAPDFWKHSRGRLDLFEIKEEIEVILRRFQIDLGTANAYVFDRSRGEFAYAGRGAPVIDGGLVSRPLARRYGFDQPVWYASLDLASLYERRSPRRRLKPLPTYPSSKRDLSLVADEDVGFGRIEKSLVNAGGKLLESLQVFDVYRGRNVGETRTAYGVRLNFRSPERTLTDAEVDQIIDKILAKLKNELDVELRS